MLQRLLRLRHSVPAGDTAWSLALEAVQLVVLTVSFALLGRSLGPAGYGAFVALMGLIGVANSFNSVGLSLTIYEHVVGKGEDPVAVARSCMGISTAMGVAASAVVVLLAAFTVRDLGLGIIVVFAVSELVVHSFVGVFVAVIMAVRGFAASAQVRIVAIIARAGVIVGLAVADNLTLGAYAVAMALLYVAFVVVTGLYTYAVLDRRSFWPGAAQRPHITTASLYAVSLTASGVRNGGDKPVLTGAGHDIDAGLYGAAYRIYEVAQMPLRALNAATHLSFLRPSSGPGQQLRLARNLSLVAALYGAVAGLGLVVVAPALPILLGDEFEGAQTIVRWLAPVVVLTSVSTYPANGLLGLGRNALRTKIMVGTGAFALALYIVLIPPFSWQGAVAATFIVEALSTVVAWIALIRCQREHDRTLVPIPA